MIHRGVVRLEIVRADQGRLRVKGTKSEEAARHWAVSESGVAGASRSSDVQDQDNANSSTAPTMRGSRLIFCEPNGAYYSPDRVGARVVEMMRGGLAGVSLHSLRHSCASIALAGGVPIAVVAERLGHADQNITLSIYSHALPAHKRAAAKVWSNAMDLT